MDYAKGFKVGDRVSVKGDSNLGTVHKVEENYIQIRIDEYSYSDPSEHHGYHGNLIERYITLIPPENGKKTIPFNLDLALSGQKVVNRSGEEIIELYFFKTSKDGYPVVAATSDGVVLKYGINGSFCPDGAIHKYDLLIQPKEKEYWIATGYVAYSQTLSNGDIVKVRDEFIYKCRPTEQEAIDAIKGKINPETIQTHKIIRYE